MTEAEIRKHLDAAEKSPREIAASVSGLLDKVLRYKPSPDKWCVLEVLGHLADAEIAYGYLLRQMLADERPTIAPINQDAWARKLNYMSSPPAELVSFYGVARHHNLRLLRTDADAAPYDWADRFNAWVKRCVRDARHEELIAYEAQGEDAARSIPTPEHYLPLLYVLATQRSTDSLSFFTDSLQLGSISMLGVRLG